MTPQNWTGGGAAELKAEISIDDVKDVSIVKDVKCVKHAEAWWKYANRNENEWGMLESTGYPKTNEIHKTYIGNGGHVEIVENVGRWWKMLGIVEVLEKQRNLVKCDKNNDK